MKSYSFMIYYNYKMHCMFNEYAYCLIYVEYTGTTSMREENSVHANEYLYTDFSVMCIGLYFT